ncbi:ATP synthase epsilon chain, sodium ion specific [Pseudobythopirellula maris]|uniref:ATP synthase epsilon chain n=1 Tax=Pseudobythopirellula maris TaxID=2527991 RepID=A0A5C5ZR12_9BACT|nr:ATP synthase F1 subunit epsilon [Pseudobythopirellula maris]TWT89934.1 ATP synthase epsilon chain, sodium ion specific [Pseudobythopirellula maris]
MSEQDLSSSPAPGLIRVTVVTPEATVLEADGDSLVLPLFDGEIGVLANHAPMIGRLGYGELRLKWGSDLTRLYVDGGFVQVADNLVSVMTDRALPVDQVDAAAAQAKLDEALSRKASGSDEIELRDKAVMRARGQIRVAAKS